MGLGATGSSEPASRGPTGLDSLQHLFGRLNGKTEAKLEAEQQNRNDLRRRGYVNRRWGSLHFVSAGLLQKDAAPPNPISKKDFVVIQSSEGDKQELRISDSPDDKSKNEPERCPLRADDQDSKLDQGGAPETKESRKDEKAQRRQERAQRKQARKLRKEEKRRRQHMPSTTAAIVPISTGDAQEVDLVTRRSTARHSAVRSRYIQQKKMAMVDTKALNEVSQALHASPSSGRLVSNHP